jgi:hypothetical protein
MTPYPVLDVVSGWSLAPDGPPPGAFYEQAVLTVTLQDEITALPPAVPIHATTATTGLIARASSGGLAGLVGSPIALYTAGFVAGAPLQVSFTAAGFLPLTLTASLGAETNFPSTFQPAALGTVALHRQPLQISGRTVSNTHAVLGNASVTLDGIWMAFSDVAANPIPAPPNLISLGSPLYADRDATAMVAQQNLTPALPSEAKTLLTPGNVGDAAVIVSNATGLAAGTIIGLDPDDPQRGEFIAITSVTQLSSGTGTSASLALAHNLVRPHAANAKAIRMIPAAAGITNSLAVAARAGDSTFFPATMAGLDGTMSFAVIASAASPAEYHAAAAMQTTSDLTTGFIRLPPVHRIAQLRLRVHHPSEPTDLLRDVMLPLGVSTLFLDLVFP